MQRELRHGAVVACAKDQADVLAVVASTQLLVDGVEVHTHLAGELRLELADLEVDDNEAAQAVVVEEQVEKELLAANDERLLATVIPT